MIENVLLLEGLSGSCGCGIPSSKPKKRKRGNKMAGMTGIRRIQTGRGIRCYSSSKGHFVKCPPKRRRYSGTSGTSGLSGELGKTKRRRRQKSSWFGSLGQVGILENFKPQLINGGLAAGGAWLSQSMGQKVGKMINVQPFTTTGNLLTLAVGVLLAGVVGKVLKKPQVGMALGVGAVAITALNFIGGLTPRTAGLGQQSGLGVLQAEAAPYYQRSALPPLAPMQALPAGVASVPNLYSDVGVASIV